jgi:uncharacterized protein (DUF486 family)
MVQAIDGAAHAPPWQVFGVGCLRLRRHAAVLVFLAAAAEARVVASDLLGGVHAAGFLESWEYAILMLLVRRNKPFRKSFSRLTIAHPVLTIAAMTSNPYLITAALLLCSNVFMTFAWYAHLRNLSDKTWLIAALASWAIAFFEYLFQVPANRTGHQVMSVGQLKIMQEVITLLVFVPFSLLYLREKLTLDYLWAGLCLMGAVFFLFRAKLA